MGSVLVVGWREAKPCFPAERNVLGFECWITHYDWRMMELDVFGTRR